MRAVFSLSTKQREASPNPSQGGESCSAGSESPLLGPMPMSVGCDDGRFISPKESCGASFCKGGDQMFPKQALRHHQFGGFAIEAHAVCPVDRSATLLHAMSRQRIVLHGLAGVYAALAVDLPPEGGSAGCAAHAVALDGVGDGFAGKAGAQPGDEVAAPGLRLLAGAAHLLVVGGLSPRPLPKRGSWLRDVCKPPLREGVGGRSLLLAAGGSRSCSRGCSARTGGRPRGAWYGCRCRGQTCPCGHRPDRWCSTRGVHGTRGSGPNGNACC